MIDYYKQVITAIKDILPTYHESFVSGAMQTPCFTVQEYGNRDTAYGETLGYSQIQFMVKTWADNMEDLETYATQADTALREAGFFRVNCNELLYDALICKLSVYEAQGFERYYES